jgi:hypothetical protein
MSRRARKQSSCARKLKRTEANARHEAERLEAKDGERMMAYPCKLGCTLPGGETAWHVGHAKSFQ